MKLSFSTLGCPEWSWEDMLVIAKDLGFDGIEVRGIKNEMHVPRSKPFSDESLEKTKLVLKRMDLEIPCLTSACFISDKEDIEAQLKSAMEYIDLAEKLGTPYIRILADNRPEPGNMIDIGYAADNISKLIEYIANKNVTILVETNGYFSSSDNMLELIKAVNNPKLGVLWDIHHPFRFFGETADKTFVALKEYIRFVHVKDSVMKEGKVQYKMPGQGDIPIKKAIYLLKQNGYKGYISLEWVKRWYIELEDPGIVFSQFINFFKEQIKQAQ